MPFRGDPRSITVPGCVDGWLALHERYGRLPLADRAGRGHRLRLRGVPGLSPARRLRAGPAVAAARRRAGLRSLVRAGQRVRRPGAARTLAAIAAEGRAGFYGGEFGRGLLERRRRASTPPATSIVRWPPGSSRCRSAVWDHDVWTIPPPSQGYLTLASAWVAPSCGLPGDPDDPAWARSLVAAAHRDRPRPPRLLWEGASGADLLAADRLQAWLAGAGSDARTVGDADRRRATDDTTYLCVVDGDGMGVSLIQSNASGFGSHVFEPSTGINLHNRGIGFSLVPGHPAEYGPGRKPPHTLCPALVTRPDGSLMAVLGTQGGDGQPQILLQVLARLLQARPVAGRAPSAAGAGC